MVRVMGPERRALVVESLIGAAGLVLTLASLLADAPSLGLIGLVLTAVGLGMLLARALGHPVSR
jgi:multisubunit Na+/H+ antiporter MnhB subunit